MRTIACYLIFFQNRSRIVGKFQRKNVDRMRFKFARRYQNKNVECTISKNATKQKQVKGAVRGFRCTNQSVRKCQNKSVKPHMWIGVKQNIRKLKGIEKSIDVCGPQPNQINIAPKDIFSSINGDYHTKLFYQMFFCDLELISNTTCNKIKTKDNLF